MAIYNLHWQIVICNWQFAIGNWQLAIGNWQFAIGNWQFAISNLKFATCNLQFAKELVIEATKDSNDKKIACLARNTIGQSSADYTLNVICKYIGLFGTFDNEGRNKFKQMILNLK